MMKNIIILFGLFLISSNLMAQQTERINEEPERKNLIAVVLAYNLIREGAEVDGGEGDLGYWVTSIGLDYLRKISERWEVGVKLDYQLGHYIIPHKDNLERENSFLILGVGSFEILPKWSVFTGGGMEFEKNEDLVVFRLGTEYAFPLKNQWEIPVGFFWDAKERYDVFTASVSVS